jgi:hypothetical protein
MDPGVARRLWRILEPYHAVTYFADRGAFPVPNPIGVPAS